MKEKIGIGIITFERFDMFKRCFESVVRCKDLSAIIIVDDCSKKDRELYDNYFKLAKADKRVKVIVNGENSGAGHSKNIILETLFEKDYDYVFTIEDDMEIINDDVFNVYINAANNNEVEYLNFAHHGAYKHEKPHFSKNGLTIHKHLTGAFSLHTKKLYEEIGLHDENYVNAMEHVDYYYMAAEKELTTPFWYFADVDGSDCYIREQPGALESSAIRSKEDWAQNMIDARKHFKDKHGIDFMKVPK